MSGMSPRERILRTMRRQTPDRVPREAVFTIPVEEEFRLRTYASDYETYFGMDRRTVQFRRPQPAADFAAYMKGRLLPEGAFADEWGNLVVHGFKYDTTDYVYPMRMLRTVAELNDYPFPDFRPPECQLFQVILQFPAHEHAVGADIHNPALREQPCNQFLNLRIDQRFTAAD